jgi:hypothetical protein
MQMRTVIAGKVLASAVSARALLTGGLMAGAVAASALIAGAQPPGFNYDESKVPAYTLPEVLTLASGTRVTDAAAWKTRRRPELVALYENEVYGHAIPRPASQRFVLRESSATALGGLATRKQVTVLLTGKEDGPKIDLLIYVPNHAPAQGAGAATGAGAAATARRGKTPAFLGLSFQGNHTVNADPDILLSSRAPGPVAVPVGGGGEPRKVAPRGAAAGSWPVEQILSQGFALVTAFYGDIEPDRADGWKEGVRAVFGPDGRILPTYAASAAGAASAQPERPAGDWGAIAAWAWGLSRALDYLETDRDIDAAQVAVIGHSRLGKAALWAGAQDERFALVVSAQSGEGGADITRRKFGETITRINTNFPHWFSDRYKTYNDRENDLPVDAHELIALVAPRPVYVSSATEDLWSDPRGEFLAAVAADPVYRLLGTNGFGGVTEMPPPDTPVGGRIGYHIRTGKHSVNSVDWDAYLAFARKQLAR